MKGMRYRTITIIVVILVICLLSSFAWGAYLKNTGIENKGLSDKDNAASDEVIASDEMIAGEGITEDDIITAEGIIVDEVIIKEEVHTSDEENDVSGEGGTEEASALVMEDGKGYIFHAEILEADAEKIARFLFGEEYDHLESADSSTGAAIKSFETGQKRLRFSAHIGMRYETAWVSDRYPDPYLFVAGNRYEMSYQKPHVTNLFPEAPESIEGYEEAAKACDEAADIIEFPYTVRDVYYIDYEFLSEIMPKYFRSGGPSWGEENMGSGPDGWSDSYWKEDETAFFFMYRMDSIECIPLGTLFNENTMTMIYSPKFGIIYISCPDKLRIIGQEETEIKDEACIEQEFWAEAERMGLMNTSIEIVSKELVYSSYEEYWSGSSIKELLPYWKVSFRGLVPDKELESIMRPDLVFRGEGQSEWYFMIPAI